MTDQTYTREQIEEKLLSSQAWLERGILAIFERQTNDEQYSEATKYLNAKGFSACDASYLSYTAKWIKSGKHLSGYHVIKARERMMKYAGQLTLIANGEL